MTDGKNEKNKDLACWDFICSHTLSGHTNADRERVCC